MASDRSLIRFRKPPEAVEPDPDAVALAAKRLTHVSSQWGQSLTLTPDQFAAFPRAPGSDDEPWDTLLAMLATDERTALKAFSQRTGLAFIEEPKLEDSASRFYELVPPDVARQHHVAATHAEGPPEARTFVLATAQPLQPASLGRLGRLRLMHLKSAEAHFTFALRDRRRGALLRKPTPVLRARDDSQGLHASRFARLVVAQEPSFGPVCGGGHAPSGDCRADGGII